VDVKGKKQGRWVIKIDEVRGEPGFEEEGEFRNSKKEGLWRRFNLQGDLIAIENYRWGNKNGKNIYFNHMGDPLREESWKAVNPDSPYDTIIVYDLEDPTKIVGKQVIKLEGFTLKHGTWKYFDNMSGTIAKTENWFLDKPAVKNGDELVPIAVTDNDGGNTATIKDEKKTSAKKPQAILEYEKKNAGKKKIKVRTGNTGG
jgi:hypothetical protein